MGEWVVPQSPWSPELPDREILQPAVTALATTGALRGRVLELCCGTGVHAVTLAGLGLDVTGIDPAPAAIARARRRAADHGVPVSDGEDEPPRRRTGTGRLRLRSTDLATLVGRGERFDSVLDTTLFHHAAPEERGRVLDRVSTALPPGGRYHLLCIADDAPGGVAGNPVSRREIADAFAERWRVEGVQRDHYLLPGGGRVPAWRVAAVLR